MTVRGLIVGMMTCGAVAVAAQTVPTLDVSRLGPPVGAMVPPVAGIDQFGRPQSLPSISGPKGAMLVFFRSADW